MKNLKPMEDAYGQEIWAYFKGERSFEIVEREDAYVDVSGGAPIYFSVYDDWPVHYKKAIELARGRVLDIGCGARRHSIYLQNKGLTLRAWTFRLLP